MNRDSIAIKYFNDHEKTIHFFKCGEMDPLIDDAIYMAKRLKALGKPVGLDVLSGLPHGFLNMVQVRIHTNFFLKFHNLTQKVHFNS